MTDRTVTVAFTEDELNNLVYAIEDRAKAGRARNALRKITNALAAPPPESEPMGEPTWPGAVVMTDWGIRMTDGSSEVKRWFTPDDERWEPWSDLRNPRPLTPRERAEHGIPAALPALDDPGLVERVARAIYDAAGPNEGGGMWERLARAALAEVAKAGGQA